MYYHVILTETWLGLDGSLRVIYRSHTFHHQAHLYIRWVCHGYPPLLSGAHSRNMQVKEIEWDREIHDKYSRYEAWETANPADEGPSRSLSQTYWQCAIRVGTPWWTNSKLNIECWLRPGVKGKRKRTKGAGIRVVYESSLLPANLLSGVNRLSESSISYIVQHRPFVV